MKKWNQILMTGIVILGISLQSFTASASQKDMEITANVKENNSLSNYSVVIPSAVSMGSLSKFKDNVQEYEIIVRSEDKNGLVSISAPEEGVLLNGNNILKFTNDFGKQTFQADETITEKCLNGKIYIAAEAVEKVSVGRYSGTTVFTIAYTEETPEPDNTTTPDSGESADMQLGKNNLSDGVYSITGNMVKVDKTTASMADKAINHTIMLTVKNGSCFLTLNFTGLDIGGMYGYMGKLSYYTDGYTQDTYGAIQGTLQSAAIDSYQENADGTRISDLYGTDYPKNVTFPLIHQAVRDGYVPLQVNVPIMDLIAGSGDQQMFLALNWSTLKKTIADDTSFDENDQGSAGTGTGNTALGGSTLGNNTLSGSLLGTNTLGNNTLSAATLGKNMLSGSTLGTNTLGSSLKTGDQSQSWLWGVLACGALIVFIKTMFFNERIKE